MPVKHDASPHRRDGVIKTKQTYVLENADMLGLECVRNGQITAAQHDLIKTLSLVVRTERDYMDICDSWVCH